MLRSLRCESASAFLLFAAALAALVWVNAWPESYGLVFLEPWLRATGGSGITLRALVNDGLMALFFFVVALEIKRELIGGELSTVPKASLPAVAALGGMVVPAALFLAFNAEAPAAAGWGVPIATDIAFCIGLLSLLRGRVPRALVVFVTAIAVFDDVGGILVIALFYGGGIDLSRLALAVLVVLVGVSIGRARVEALWIYAVLGGALWWTVHEAGVHPTIAGVALGLIVPTARRGAAAASVGAPADAGRLVDAVTPLARFHHALHAPVAFIVLPLFALANSGVSLGATGSAAVANPVTMGVVAALVIGKPLGIVLPTLAAVRMGMAPMPGASTRIQLLGVSMCAGIGFTVSLFIAALAYHDAPELLEQAKLGVLAASAFAGAAGYGVLRLCARSPVSC
jgi:Na+:H+ antiporter, NhaA family